jgi:adenylate kinase family enzyme
MCEVCDNSCHGMNWQTHIREPLTGANRLLAVTEGLLSSLVGVEEIKERVREKVITYLEDCKTARLRGIKHTLEAPVMLLVGNPGTGKTTIANVLAKVFVAVGMSNSTIVSLRKDTIPRNSLTFFEKLANQVQNGVLIVDELQNYQRCTNFTQFLVQQTDKSLAGRPVVILMGYPSPRKPNVEDYIRNSDSGVSRRLTDVLAVPNFTTELVVELLVDKLEHRGYRLGLSANRLRRYVREIPQHFYEQLNGTLAEKIVAQATSMQALAVYTANIQDLDARLTLNQATMKLSVGRVIASLARDKLAVSASG